MRKSSFQSLASGNFDLKKEYSKFFYYKFSTSRNALDEYLSKYSSPGQIIYYPEFICKDFLSPAYNNKLKIKFYKISENLDATLKDIETCRYIVMVNYFGFSANLNNFQRVAEIKNAILIEDNAHGFLSRDINYNLLGTRANVGVISIRKIVDFDSAAILISEKELENIKIKNDFINNKIEYKYKIKFLIKKILYFSPVIFGIFFYKIFNLFKKKKYISDFNEEFKIPINNHISKYLLKDIIFIDAHKEVAYRRHSFKVILELAMKYKIKLLLTTLDKNISPYCFPYIKQGADYNIQKFESEVFSKGYFITKWPSLPSNIVFDKSNNWMNNVNIVHFNW